MGDDDIVLIPYASYPVSVSCTPRCYDNIINIGVECSTVVPPSRAYVGFSALGGRTAGQVLRELVAPFHLPTLSTKKGGPLFHFSFFQ